MGRKKHTDTNYFTRHMYLRMFVPSFFSSMGLALGNVADALFVGIDIGGDALAAMALVAPVYMIYNVLELGISIGASVHYTRLLGAGKPKEGVCVFSQMTVMCIAVSIMVGALGLAFMPQILTLLGAGAPGSRVWVFTREYLEVMFAAAPVNFIYFLLYFCIRCDDGQKLASAGYVVGYTADVVLSYVFILVFGLGVRGAIYATVAGKLIGLAIFLAKLFQESSILRFRFLKPDLPLMFRCFKSGFVSSSSYLFQFFVLIAANNILVKLGGNSAIAVFNVIANVSYILTAVYDAVGNTVQPVAGTLYSEKNTTAQKYTLKISLLVSYLLSLAACALAFTFAGPICRLFGLRELAETGALALRMYVPAGFLCGTSIVAGYYFQAISRERIVLFINVLRNCAVYLAAMFFLASLGLPAMWWMFALTEVVSLAIWLFAVRLKRNLEDERVVLSYFINDKGANIPGLIDEIQEFCQAHEASDKQTYYVTMCVDEICQAIINTAFQEGGQQYIQLTLIALTGHEFELHIRDNAKRFNPFAMNTQGIDLAGDSSLDSLGILMVKTKAKDFFYRRYSGFNTLTVKI